STANRYIVTWPSVQSSHEERGDGFSWCPVVPLQRFSAAPAPVSSAPARGLRSSRTRLRTRSTSAWAGPTINKRADTARTSNILRRHGTDDAGHGASTHY